MWPALPLSGLWHPQGQGPGMTQTQIQGVGEKRRGVERLTCRTADPPVRSVRTPVSDLIPGAQSQPRRLPAPLRRLRTRSLLPSCTHRGRRRLGCHLEDLGARPWLSARPSGTPGRHPVRQRSVGGGHPLPRTASPALFWARGGYTFLPARTRHALRLFTGFVPQVANLTHTWINKPESWQRAEPTGCRTCPAAWDLERLPTVLGLQIGNGYSCRGWGGERKPGGWEGRKVGVVCR